jgi:putative transposase
VKAKSGLNRPILEQGWDMFVQMLDYKQIWLGGEVIKVSPQHTSQTCPDCLQVSKDNRVTQPKFKCISPRASGVGLWSSSNGFNDEAGTVGK